MQELGEQVEPSGPGVPVHEATGTKLHEASAEQQARGCGQGLGVQVVSAPWKTRRPVQALRASSEQTPALLQHAPIADTLRVNAPAFAVVGEKLPTRMR